MASINYEFKIIIVGDAGVGKTCLVASFLDNPIPTTYVQTEEKSVYTHWVKLQNKSLCIKLWDFSGGDNFRTLTAAQYEGAHGAIIAYSMTDTESYVHMQYWQQNILTYIPKADAENLKMLVVGLKSDSIRVCIDEDKAKNKAEAIGCKHYTATYKNKGTVKEVFNELLVQMIDEAKRNEKEKHLKNASSPLLQNSNAKEYNSIASKEETPPPPSICSCLIL
ncbi:ras-related protein Rab-1B-like [Hydractinia symbiolongicarpus]|uniref:ras-related protein Rab-1B-like n=1 Tax=Hydractinia symbiolongicarpus TaxID=13093 RepID=UPI00254DC67D|nr:ras-related protein Rab-1B-like [Hydractinia symbiolongicarpus]